MKKMEAINSLLPPNNLVIDKINDEFNDAMNHLKRQDVIGLALEPPKCDRYGDLEWLSVSTSMCTFLFDIQKLQKSAFREGLKTVLENPRIVKILHDCRRPSDCLFHQYDTKLTNVYDTQVADFLANVQRVSLLNVSRAVNNLYHCLEAYLKIPEDFFDPRPIDDEYSVRPMMPFVKDFFVKNVIYLRLLKKELDMTLRMPYRRCVDIYMQSILRKTDGEIKLCPPQSGTVPPEMAVEGMQVFQITENLPESGAFAVTRENYEYENVESGYGNVADNHFTRDFDRTEVVKFLMDRMFYGKNLNNASYSPSVESDQCSVKSVDVCSSVCDPVSLVKRSKDIDTCSSSLSKLKALLRPSDHESDSKPMLCESQCVSDTSSLKARSEKSLSRSKTIDLVRHLRLKGSVHQSVDQKSKQGNQASLDEFTKDSAISNLSSVKKVLKDEPVPSREVNNNLIKTSNILESMDEVDPITVVTSKDISPIDKYKYIMSNRSKASSRKSSVSSDPNNKMSPKHGNRTCSHSAITLQGSSNQSSSVQPQSSSEVVVKKSVEDFDKCSSSDESDDVHNEEDPWEKLRSAFDNLGPQRPIKKSLFVPAGMSY